MNFYFEQLENFKLWIQEQNLVLEVFENLQHHLVEKHPTFQEKSVEEFILKLQEAYYWVQRDGLCEEPHDPGCENELQADLVLAQVGSDLRELLLQEAI